MSDFVLDRESNPHPVMLTAALHFRRSAKAGGDDTPLLGAYWLGYVAAMCDATGLPRAEIEAWMDYHDDFDPAAVGTHVEAPRRKR